MKKLCKLVIIFSFILLTSNPSFAKITQNKDGLFLKDITTQELLDVYKFYKYNDYIHMPDWKYPPIFLDNLPRDFDQIKSASERNRIFLQITGPIALKINQETLKERDEILAIEKSFKENKKFSDQEIKILEEKSKKYDVFTRLTGLRRHTYMLDELIMKVDMVPASILMGVAAIESNWGTSDVAQKANNLYKEKIWYTDEGLIPQDDEEDDSYRYKVFNSLYDSMNSYAIKVNSNINYKLFRFERSEIRYRDKPVFGRILAHAMIFDTPLENFAGLLDYTITFYEIINFDEASLMQDLKPYKK